MRRLAVLALAGLGLGAATASPAARQGQAKQVTWKFDNLERIGGFPVRVEGAPKVVSSPVGSAIEFDGLQDALFIEHHPLAGAKTFTWEVIFRPDGGAEQQRWFHLAERDPRTGELVRITGTDSAGRRDANRRLLFEVRIAEGGWYLDAFTPGRVLMFPEKLHSIGRWYHVAQTYDGKMFRSYVDGELQGDGALDYQPQGDGAASIGARMNKVDYFRGAVAKARFTFEALTPDQFMLLPK